MHIKMSKLCYIILTCEAYKDTRYKYQEETFLQDVKKEDIYCLSKNSDVERRIFGMGTEDNYASCPQKYINFFNKYKLDYDWYFFIDDDTYVYVDRLNKFIDILPVFDRPVLIGYLYITSESFWPYGGGGFLCNRKTYNILQGNAISYFGFTAGDMLIGQILRGYNTMFFNFHKEFCPQKDSEEPMTFHYINSRDDFFQKHELKNRDHLYSCEQFERFFLNIKISQTEKIVIVNPYLNSLVEMDITRPMYPILYSTKSIENILEKYQKKYKKRHIKIKYR